MATTFRAPVFRAAAAAPSATSALGVAFPVVLFAAAFFAGAFFAGAFFAAGADFFAGTSVVAFSAGVARSAAGVVPDPAATSRVAVFFATMAAAPFRML
ncbi:hypothetical protein ACIRP0_17155 [Streptomyces sp. NPDC101733]|uniref:hypothetical protein n=1 Tax=unclassified Streptomyces TaxID=2593676 RepID=UPI00344066E8